MVNDIGSDERKFENSVIGVYEKRTSCTELVTNKEVMRNQKIVKETSKRLVDHLRDYQTTYSPGYVVQKDGLTN